MSVRLDLIHISNAYDYYVDEFFSQFMQGDSGGPLMCRRDNQYVACGLVTGGNRACRIQDNTYFTRLSNYRDWIRQKIEGKQCDFLKNYAEDSICKV